MGGSHRKHVCLPQTRARGCQRLVGGRRGGRCWRTLRCVRVGRRAGIGACECLGAAVGRKKRLKESWREELSPSAKSLLPFGNKSPVSSVTQCLFPGQTLRNRQPPLPSPVPAISAGIFRRLTRPSALPAARAGRAGGIPAARARHRGSTRLRDPPLAELRPRPAAASPSALIKTCEMKRLARAAPFYLQHLSCC